MELICIEGYEGADRLFESTFCEHLSILVIVTLQCNNLSISFFSMQISKTEQYLHLVKKSKIRISGDGTKFSRMFNFILLSYAILEPSIGQYLSGLGKKVNRPTVLMQLCLLFIILSVHAGSHTIAVVKGMEDYEIISH